MGSVSIRGLMLFRRLIWGHTAKESRALAAREHAERIERQSRLRCDHHPCHTCGYFATVYAMAADGKFKDRISDMLADHVWACRDGQPNSSSCGADNV